MQTIWKFPITKPGDIITIEMPEGSQVLTVQTQAGTPCLWAVVEDSFVNNMESRQFAIVGTGHPMPNGTDRYIGTFQLHGGGLVFHVFEI